MASEGGVLDSSHLKIVEELFKECDLDGDGKIDRNELRATVKRLNGGNHVDELELEELFTTLDKKGKGYIDFEEFAEGLAPLLLDSSASPTLFSASSSIDEDPYKTPSSSPKKPSKMEREGSTISLDDFRKRFSDYVSTPSRGSSRNSSLKKLSINAAYDQEIEALTSELNALKKTNTLLRNEVNASNDRQFELLDRLEKEEEAAKEIRKQLHKSEKVKDANKQFSEEIEKYKEEISTLKEKETASSRITQKLVEEKKELTKVLQEKIEELKDLKGETKDERALTHSISFDGNTFGNAPSPLVGRSRAQTKPKLNDDSPHAKAMNEVITEYNKLKDDHSNLLEKLRKYEEMRAQMKILQQRSEDDKQLMEKLQEKNEELKKALEEHQTNSFSNTSLDTPAAKSVWSELETEVEGKFTPRILELEEQLKRLKRTPAKSGFSPRTSSEGMSSPEPLNGRIEVPPLNLSPIKKENDTQWESTVKQLEEENQSLKDAMDKISKTTPSSEPRVRGLTINSNKVAQLQDENSFLKNRMEELENKISDTPSIVQLKSLEDENKALKAKMIDMSSKSQHQTRELQVQIKKIGSTIATFFFS
eukprot:TRINITY_DN6288_c0_g1_i2.p1 TRINITY_DN6288_c0_g1~~TRINITY_DN6288_c0_g1_i2.p1  ORF type:complete len:593 (-),score=281.43 TRINITY_DN6288_c0_g1_i2:407-2185(-)